MNGPQISRLVVPFALATLSISRPSMVANGQTDPIVWPPCNDLLLGENEIVGTVCAEVVGGLIEIDVTTTSSDCLIFESHICNVPTVQFVDDGGVENVPYSLNVEQVYDFVCSGLDGDTFIIAGHATLQCGTSTEPLSSYYEIELICSPDGIRSEEVKTEATPVTAGATTAAATTVVLTTPGAVDTGDTGVATTPGVGEDFIPTTPGVEEDFIPTTPGVEEDFIPTTPGVEEDFIPTTPGVEEDFIPTTTGAEEEFIPTTRDVGVEFVRTTTGAAEEFIPTTPGAAEEYKPDTTGKESGFAGAYCPPRLEPCPDGTYVMESCECSPVSDPCGACPIGTRCQQPRDGVPLLCIACECGFCAAAEDSCCEVNAHGNNCKDATNAKECNLQNDFYPTFIGSGNSCAGVEVVHNIPSGCGCVPSRETSCAYDPSEQTLDSRCYVCDNDDLLIAHNDEDHTCYDCRICMKTCDACVGASKSLEDMAKCMRSKPMEDCRKSCVDKCLKA